MIRLTGGIKLEDAGAANPEQTQAPNAELLNDVNQTITEIDEFEAEYAWALNDEQLANLRRILLTLKAEQAALSAYGASGGSSNPSTGNTNPVFDLPEDLSPYWNGMPPDCISQDDLRSLIESRPEAYGEYMGTVNMPYNSAQTGMLAFQMPENAIAIWGETIGNHMAITIQIDEGGTTKYQTWIVRNATTRPDPIVISARGLDHKVTIDMSRVVRINDGSYPASSYENQKFYIVGTNFDDIIDGSQIDDNIMALAGNDIIRGNAGADTLYGDYGGGTGQFTDADGNDTVIGGAGEDTIYAGGGIDTVSRSDRGESVWDAENWENDVIPEEELPAWDSFVRIDGGATFEQVPDSNEPATIVLENTGSVAGTLTIDMGAIPGNYTMCTGERDSNGDLVLTFVGEGGTFKLRIKDFFNNFNADNPADKIWRLNIIGTNFTDFIDVRSCGTLTTQVINISSGDQNDIVLNTNYQFLADGGHLDGILESQGNSHDRLEDIADDGIFGYNERRPDGSRPNMRNMHGFTSRVEEGSRVIVIEGEADAATDDLYLGKPEGYDKAYVTEDREGRLYVIFMKSTTDGSRADTIVVRIDARINGQPITLDNLRICRWVPDASSSTGNGGTWNPDVEKTVISYGYDGSGNEDYLTDSGEGDGDTVMAQRGSRTRGAESVTETDPVPPASTTPPGTGSGGGTGGGGST